MHTSSRECCKCSVIKNSTNGLSRETSWNIHTIMKYLEENSNHLSFPDTNYNVKKTAVTNLWEDMVLL